MFLRIFTPNWLQIVALITAGMASFQFGISMAWSSPTIPILMQDPDFNLTLNEASYLIIIPGLGVCISATITAFLMNIIGRKLCLLFSAVPYFLCYIIIIFTNSLSSYYVARFFSGISDGIISAIAPAYIGEITTPKVRGRWGNASSLLYYGGQVFINAVGGYLSVRSTSIVLCVLPILFFSVFILMPESPYFYLMKNREEDARKSLKMMLWKEDVDNEFKQLKLDVNRQMSEKASFVDMFTTKVHRKALLLVSFVRAMQILSGVYVFVAYTMYFFNLADSSISSTLSSIAFTTVLFLTNVVACFFLHKIGRRISLICSSLGCAITLAIVSVYFWIMEFTDVDLTPVKWFPLFGLIVYIIAYSLGLGVLPALVSAELFSTSIKHYGLLVVNLTFGIYLCISIKFFDYFLDAFGTYFPFAFFSVCSFLCFVTSIFVLPETKDKSLEEIQQQLMGKKNSKSMYITK